MSLIQEPAIPLYDAVVKGYQTFAAAGADSEDMEVRRARQSAFEKFRLLGFPSIRNEDWKYTNIGRFLKDEFALSGVVPGEGPLPAVSAPADLVKKATIHGFDACQIVLVNGVWDGKVKGTLPKGVEVFKVAQVLNDPQFAGYFGNGKWGNQHFAHLNTALFTDGLFVRVKDGAAVEKPLHVVHVFTADRNLLIQPRHVWVAGRNSEASIVATVVSAADGVKLWVNSLMEIFAETDAKLDHVVLQTAGSGVRQVQHTTVRQKKQSL